MMFYGLFENLISWYRDAKFIRRLVYVPPERYHLYIHTHIGTRVLLTRQLYLRVSLSGSPQMLRDRFEYLPELLELRIGHYPTPPDESTPVRRTAVTRYILFCNPSFTRRCNIIYFDPISPPRTSRKLSVSPPYTRAHIRPCPAYWLLPFPPRRPFAATRPFGGRARPVDENRTRWIRASGAIIIIIVVIIIVVCSPRCTSSRVCFSVLAAVFVSTSRIFISKCHPRRHAVNFPFFPPSFFHPRIESRNSQLAWEPLTVIFYHAPRVFRRR